MSRSFGVQCTITLEFPVDKSNPFGMHQKMGRRRPDYEAVFLADDIPDAIGAAGRWFASNIAVYGPLTTDCYKDGTPVKVFAGGQLKLWENSESVDGRGRLTPFSKSAGEILNLEFTSEEILELGKSMEEYQKALTEIPSRPDDDQIPQSALKLTFRTVEDIFNEKIAEAGLMHDPYTAGPGR